jgi:hypothetical protein
MILSLNVSTSAFGQSKEPSRKIVFPDIPGYNTMICDFHQHSVFSDGLVWPSIRVAEALFDGLDAISVTDHIEYLPNSGDIPFPDRNRVFQIAQEAAKDQDLLVISGSRLLGYASGTRQRYFHTDAHKLVGSIPWKFSGKPKASAFFSGTITGTPKGERNGCSHQMQIADQED